MKKFILILLLFAMPVVASDWCATLGNYRTEIKARFGKLPGYTDYPFSDTTLNQYIRGGAIHVSAVLRCNPLSKTFVTAYKDYAYSLDTLFLGISAVEWSYNDSLKELIYVPRAQWVTLEVKTTDGKDGYSKRPSYYDYTSDSLYLYPPPTKAADTFYIYGWRRVPSIAAVDSLAIIDQEYRVAVLNYTCYQIAKAISHPQLEMFYKDYVDVVNALSAWGASEKAAD